jgi:hypothetical protein
MLRRRSDMSHWLKFARKTAFFGPGIHCSELGGIIFGQRGLWAREVAGGSKIRTAFSVYGDVRFLPALYGNLCFWRNLQFFFARHWSRKCGNGQKLMIRKDLSSFQPSVHLWGSGNEVQAYHPQVVGLSGVDICVTVRLCSRLTNLACVSGVAL